MHGPCSLALLTRSVSPRAAASRRDAYRARSPRRTRRGQARGRHSGSRAGRSWECAWDALDVEVEALRDSGAYREGAKLDDLRAQARRLREHAERADRVAAESVVARDEAAQQLAETGADRDMAVANRELATADLRQSAARAGADAVVSDADQVDDADEAERLVRAWLAGRRALVAEVRAALAAHGCHRQRVFCEQRVAEDLDVADRRAAIHESGVETHVAAVDAYASAVAEWAGTCAAIGADRVRAVVPEPATDPAEVEAAVATLGTELHGEHAVGARTSASDVYEMLRARAELVAERDQFAEGRLVEPEAPSWRSDRTGRPGAPLWRLVDVAPGVDATTVDGFETALTAAGILDAWVMPDGQVDWDTWCRCRGRRRARSRALASPTRCHRSTAPPCRPTSSRPCCARSRCSPRSQTQRRRPESSCSAGTGRSESALPLAAGVRRPASVVGAAAQERRRLARLAELDAAIATAGHRLAAVEREAEALQRRDAVVRGSTSRRCQWHPGRRGTPGDR